MLSKIPIGTPRVDAERILKTNDLNCIVKIDPKTNEPFLSCRHSDNSDFWVTWEWMIRIDCSGDRVSDISIDKEGIGL